MRRAGESSTRWFEESVQFPATARTALDLPPTQQLVTRGRSSPRRTEHLVAGRLSGVPRTQEPVVRRESPGRLRPAVCDAPRADRRNGLFVIRSYLASTTATSVPCGNAGYTGSPSLEEPAHSPVVPARFAAMSQALTAKEGIEEVVETLGVDHCAVENKRLEGCRTSGGAPPPGAQPRYPAIVHKLPDTSMTDRQHQPTAGDSRQAGHQRRLINVC